MDVEVVIYAKENPERPYMVKDVVDMNYTTAAQGGYLTCNMKLARRPGRAYPELDYRNHVEVYSLDGELVWVGYVSGLPQQSGDKQVSYEVNCRGYVDDLVNQPLWKPNYPAPGADVGDIIRAGVSAYCPSLIVNSTTCPTVGLTIQYATDNLNDVKVHLDNMIRYGNNQNKQLYYQVWGRTFYLVTRPDQTSPQYTINFGDIDSIDAGQNGDNYYDQITVKYKTDTDILFVTLPNTTGQARYGSRFGAPQVNATVSNFVKSPKIVDISNHGVVTDAAAAALGQTLLNKFSTNVRLLTSKVTITRKLAVCTTLGQGPIEKCKMRAGQWIQVNDFFSNDPTVGAENSSIFVGQTDYNPVSRVLSITDESQADLESFLARLISRTGATIEVQ